MTALCRSVVGIQTKRQQLPVVACICSHCVCRDNNKKKRKRVTVQTGCTPQAATHVQSTLYALDGIRANSQRA